MKRKIFAIILLAMTISFYSCQKEENNPIDNNANKGVKKMTPENEAIYNSIVDFREKLLKKDYKAGESISTEDAILLMEASLNLTYRHSDLVENKMRTIESSVSVDGDFSNSTIEYSKVYKTYEDILNSVRNVYASIEEENKKVRVIDLALNRDNTITISTAFEIRINLPVDVPHGDFITENLKIEVAVHNRHSTVFIHSAIYDVIIDYSTTKSDLTIDDRAAMKWMYTHGNDDVESYFVKNYFVNNYAKVNNAPYFVLGSTNGFGSDFYSELEGIQNIKTWVFNRENYLGGKTLTAFELGIYENLYDENDTYAWLSQTMENKHYADCVIWACPAIDPLDISVDY